MLFNVNVDTPNFLLGYVVPDSFVGRCDIVVMRDGQEILRKPSGDRREELRIGGRHETGDCGFVITEQDLPDLAHIPDFQIYEPESGLMIFRRCPPEAVVPQRIFRLETQLLPLARLDRALQPRFQLHYPLIDRFGVETHYQVFLLNRDSVFISGRVPYRSLEHYIDQGFETIALIQDPFEEMAERILVMRLMAQGYQSYLGARDAVGYEEAIAFAADLQLEDERDLKRAFRDISLGAETVLGDPLLRQLTTRLPSEAVQPASVAGALNTLSSFKIVGLRHHGHLFVEDVAAQFSLDPADLPTIDQIPATKALAERLRACPPVELLLENDLALYGYVRDAFEKPGTRD